MSQTVFLMKSDLLDYFLARKSQPETLSVEDSSYMTRRPLVDDVGGEGRLRDTSPALHRA